MPFSALCRSAVLALSLLAPLAGAAVAQEEVAAVEPAVRDQPSPRALPLPRYVSLKSERVNLRVGPGRDYPVSWLYLKSGLPMEVIQEYDNWRRVRDSEGVEGWVYHSLLSGERTAIAAPWLKGKAAIVEMRRSAADDATIVAHLEPGVLTKVAECGLGWCQIEAGGRRGFVAQTEIWGVYPDERF